MGLHCALSAVGPLLYKQICYVHARACCFFIYSRDNQNCFFIDCYRTDPVRPFISGHVANSMAAEVIALLHSLLTAPETHTAQLWSSAVEIVST